MIVVKTFNPIEIKVKTLTFFIAMVTLLQINGQNKNTEQTQSSNITEDKIIDSLLTNYKTTELINKLRHRIVEALQKNDQQSLADAYYDLARSYNTIGHFESSEEYYLKSLDIYRTYNNIKKIDVLQNALLEVYANNHNNGPKVVVEGESVVNSYKARKFDSLQPIVINLSKKLNSEQVFIIYKTQITNGFYRYPPDSLLAISTRALEAVSKVKIKDLNFSSDVNPTNLQRRLELEFTYIKAFSMLKIMATNNTEPPSDEAYKIIFSIDVDEYAKYILKDNEYYGKLSALYYYRAKYYHEFEKNQDSAYKYMSLSDGSKFKSILNYRKRTATNGALIHQITKVEDELIHANDLLLKDKEIALNYKYMLIFAGCLIVTLSGFLVHYYRSRRKIVTINSQLEASNTKLKSLDKERLNFFSVLSHELRTPVYGISGLTEILLEEKNEEQRKQNLNSLKLSINYIMFLINNVLQFSKFGKTSKRPTLQPVDIRKLIYNTLETVRVFAKSKNIQLELVAEKLPKSPLSVDRTSLKQVLTNLVYNAIKFTPSGTVKLKVTETEVTQKGIVLLFEVIDEGVGISAADQENLFDAYKVIGKDITNSGTGLGLYIVKSLLEINGSQIKLKSKLGVGSNFYFEMTFPFAITPKPEKIEELVMGTELKKVLIVDDNKINLLVSKKNVERLGQFTAITVLSGAEAITKAKEINFDLILMDINMPEMDGFEATTAIRQFNKNVPIIALTALNYHDVQEQSIKVGMNAIITKPYNQTEFKKAIFHYCREMSISVA